MDQLIIIGFQKCGQTALSAYLKCKVNELIYYPDAVERFKSHYEYTHRPVFITRDPTEKLWSEYHYFERYHKEMTFIEFLDHRSDQVDQGYTTPIERCDYFRWIEPFKQFNPLVLSLENPMQTLMQPMNVGQKIKSRPTYQERMAIRERLEIKWVEETNTYTVKQWKEIRKKVKPYQGSKSILFGWKPWYEDKK